MNKIRIDLKKGRIKEYEVLSLSHEIPDFMIPVSFVDYGDVYSATYDYSGFTSIANAAMPLGVRDVLDCLESIVIAYRKAHTYLLFPDRFTLNSDTVYVNPEKREIRLLFLPPEEDITSSEELRKFIVQLKEMGDCNEVSDYLDIITEHINSNCGLRELQNRIVMMKRDALICGIS